jgi:hypothetical protein
MVCIWGMREHMENRGVMLDQEFPYPRSLPIRKFKNNPKIKIKKV